MINDLFYGLGIVLAAGCGAAGYRLVCTGWLVEGRGTARERAMLRTLVDHLPDNLYVKDVEGRFVLANVAVARVMGATTPGGLLGIRVNLRTGNLGASALGFALGGLRYPGAIRSCSLPRVMSGR